MPHHGLGRGFKVGKEEIVGLIVALRAFVTADPAIEVARCERLVAAIAQRLAGVPHVEARTRSADETGRFPQLEVRLDEAALGRTALHVSAVLQAGDPPVHLSERRAVEGILTVQPEGLQERDDRIVADRLRAALGGAV